MKIDVETVSPVQKRVAIEVPWDTVAEELELAYRGLQKRARVKGFRAGKVPRKVLEQFYKTAVEGEVLQRLVEDSFRKAVQEKELFPINTPTVNGELRIEPDAPFRFIATVEVKPEVVAQNYKGLEVVRQVRQVTDDEVDRELEGLRTKATVIEQITDRTDLQKGDLAVIDFFGYVNGETFKGGKGINYTVEVGASQMIPGFEDQLVGMKVGEHKTFNLVFPNEEGPEEVRGKDVQWKVDLKELKRKILPELDDEFAKDLGEFDSLVELKTKIRENLRTRADARSRRQIREKAIEKLVERNPVDVPPVMVERQLDFLLSEVSRIAQQNKDPAVRDAIARLREEQRDRAQKQVAGMLLLEAVGRLEGVELAEAELEARLGEIARENRITAKQVRTELQRDGRLEALRYDMRQDKALDVIVQAAVVSEEILTGERTPEEMAEDGHEEFAAPTEADHEHALPHLHDLGQAHDHDHDHGHTHDHG